MNNAKRNTLLIVDDDPTSLNLLFDHLGSAGFEILVAEDGPSALQRASHGQPDLILLDVMMPGMNGFETCRHLKDEDATENIPVIFMTAMSRVEDKIKGFEAGGVDYITKPFQNAEMLARINTHLSIHNLQQELQRRLQELQAHNEELDAFAHTVAHDLSNPLDVIIGYAEMLEEDAAKLPVEELQNYAAAITRNGNKMNNIIEALLLLAGVRKQEVRLDPLDMELIVDDVQHRLAGMIGKYRPNLAIPASWPQAIGYAPWVEEVWANYLSNAIKYGEQPLRIELGSAVEANGMIRFWVRDNGPGISPQKQSSLFTPFSRFHLGEVEGHGLGLSIAQRIVEKLGGQVSVESDGVAGRGSTFSFTLPPKVK